MCLYRPSAESCLTSYSLSISSTASLEGQDLPLLLQQAPRSLSQGSATVLQALLDPSLSSKSGAFLDSCHVQPLPNIDFPAGEPGADALWARSEQLVGEQFQWCGAA